MWNLIDTSGGKDLYLSSMPYRLHPLVTGHVYHIYNRGVEKRQTFIDKRDYRRALETLKYYRNKRPPVKLSRFLILPEAEKDKINHYIETEEKIVELLCYALMPNHFHFLLIQKIDGGISKSIKNFTDSFTRYFNTRHERIGPLFQGQFKAVLIESDEQLIHVSRYIHLNPFSSSIVSKENLVDYPWSSLGQYLDKEDGICNIEMIKSYFPSTEKYLSFLLDQADYQRALEQVKHLTFE